MRVFHRLCWVLAFAVAVVLGETPSAAAQTTAGPSAGPRQDGFIPLRYDAATGKLFLEVTPDQEFIYANSLSHGMGADEPRLDRGTLEYTGQDALARFERHGPNVHLIVENMRFRAQTDDPWAVRAVEESFPSAVYAAFPIVAEQGGRLVVDGTEFFLTDVFDVVGRIREADQGNVRIDRARSYISMDATKAFPRNTNVRAVVTYVTDDPGPELRRHAPDAPLHGRAITLQQQHAFVELPPEGFTARKFDPRVGSRHTEFWDFAEGFDEDYHDRYIWRWRLEKRDPSAALSEPVTPIVFHLDPAIPEPYRSAYREGTLWWNEAFEAAGFRNAIQVRDLPPDADPLDVRYSTLLHVHRTKPGSSTGPHVKDPRTGEILHAVVRMDSFRSLVDYNYYMGLVPALKATGSPIPVDAEQMAMMRRRQHVAHEVGHALGFEHNFIASTLGRMSVMDYPPPFVKLDAQGRLDLSEIYAQGPGDYDRFLARYTYTPFVSPEAEAEGLDAIVREGLAKNLRYLAGRDSSPEAAHPDVHRWVEGPNMIDALARTIAVRRILLEHFSEEAIAPGEPMALLVDRLTHVYLHHRDSIEAAIKYIGGVEYTYALRGDGQTPTRIYPGPEQRKALDLILSTLAPEALAIPERISRLIPPTPLGYEPDERWARFATGEVFDPLAFARALASEVVDGLLHPERAARVVSLHARESSSLSLDAVVSALMAATWDPANRGASSMDGALLRITQRAVVDGLLDLAAARTVPAEARAVAHSHLVTLAAQLAEDGSRSGEDLAHRRLVRDDIERFVETGGLGPRRTGVNPMPLPWP